MTPRQLEVLDMIREGISRTGYAPTLEEIGDKIGASKTSVHGHVSILVCLGKLRRVANKSRGIELADRPDLRPVDSQALRDELARRGQSLTALSIHEPLAFGRAVSCAADCCQVEVQRGHLFCRRHWFMLPAQLREGIMRAFGTKDEVLYGELVTEARDTIDATRVEMGRAERAKWVDA